MSVGSRVIRSFALTRPSLRGTREQEKVAWRIEDRACCPVANRHGNGSEPMTLFGLLGSRRHERAGFALYTRSVEAARDPLYFERLGVPDTMDGRFDLIGLFAALTIRRLRLAGPPGPKLAQAVFDAMFADLDFTLREMGVGDLSVAKRMREMWEAFHGRALAYDAPLTQADHVALAEALGRNVWRGAPPAGAADALARAVLVQDGTLATQPLTALAAGQIHFIPAQESLAEPVPA